MYSASVLGDTSVTTSVRAEWMNVLRLIKYGFSMADFWAIKGLKGLLFLNSH